VRKGTRASTLLDHGPGEVAVRIEADGQRDVAGDGADAAEEFALHVREGLSATAAPWRSR
jgi:hypothetical protein